MSAKFISLGRYNINFDYVMFTYYQPEKVTGTPGKEKIEEGEFELFLRDGRTITISGENAYKAAARFEAGMPQ
jgi:hypothetical protein